MSNVDSAAALAGFVLQQSGNESRVRGSRVPGAGVAKEDARRPVGPIASAATRTRACEARARPSLNHLYRRSKVAGGVLV